MSLNLLFYLLLSNTTPKIVEVDIPVPSIIVPQRKSEFSLDRLELDCLAKNIYHESKGESKSGKWAVANVSLNRLAHPAFPDTICDVVYQKRKVCEFSWVCDGKRDITQFDEKSWEESKEIAKKAIEKKHVDNTGGALFFHNNKVNPRFHKKRKRTTRIGNHMFYK